MHECVFAICSSYFRTLIRYAKEKTNTLVEIDFKIYPKELLVLFFDLVYNVNAKDLLVNEILKMVDFIADCGHCDEEKYPWHYRTRYYIFFYMLTIRANF